MPSLEDFKDKLIDVCGDYVDDTIQYRMAGGAWVGVKAFVEYRDAVQDISTGKYVEQDHVVKVAKRFVADRPTSNCRVRLSDYPRVEFKPINTLDVGDDWQFEVRRV